jgi:aspartate aminotransferase-like enzyme/GNAT superfamily N-acetyltransferase
MNGMPRALHYKIADTEAEYEAIHRLNHRTFAEEIPQHSARADGRLVDRFHAENTYAVCLDGTELVGMLAGRAARPFSLDGKLDDLDRYLPTGRRPVEIRLLAVQPAYRHGAVPVRLIQMLTEHFRREGCDLAIISGTTRALDMYHRLGFVPFGPLTGRPGAFYQPMYLRAPGKGEPHNFLPGPVAVAPEVTAALAAPAQYHRGPAHLEMLARLNSRLAAMVNATHCQLLMGSGTLANDVVAGQLVQLATPGLVWCEGEFGERLTDHAARAGLSFDIVHDQAALAAKVAGAGWVWASHCETSTGVLLDLPRLAELCAAGRAKLAVDCISSIGTVPIDLSRVHLASGASGKALRGYPGISMVFYHDRPKRAAGIPRYLDLKSYVDANGVAFTQSSNLVAALAAAVDGTDWADRYARLADASAWLHRRLRRVGFTVVAPADRAAPGIVSVAPEGDAFELGRRMEHEGYLLAYHSGYLRARNWLQISLMGHWTWPALRELPTALVRARA